VSAAIFELKIMKTWIVRAGIMENLAIACGVAMNHIRGSEADVCIWPLSDGRFLFTVRVLDKSQKVR
jgi:hypothetical protein